MFQRTNILYGDGVCEKIQNAVVVVCGVGAVGSFACEALARLGVGSFHLYDCDAFEASNVNRQLCALHSTIGRNKVEVQKERILDINPSAKVEAKNIFIDEHIAREIAELKPTVVVDAIDCVASKIALAKCALEASVPFVSSMGAARRKNPLAVSSGDIFKTSGCPLATRIRKQLRKDGFKKGFKCVYSDEIVAKESHISSGSSEDCEKKVIGSSVIVTGVFGLNLANLALSEIVGRNF